MAWSVERFSSLFEVKSGPKRNRSMEGLRGLAVTLIFFAHYKACLAPWMEGVGGVGAGIAETVRIMGAVGVDLFFLMSGFLIYGVTLSPNFSWGKFMRRRFQRIYPPFLAVFALYLVLSYVFPAESKIPDGTYAGAIYVLQNLLLMPGIFPIQPMITVAWTLSYDLYFYFVLPLLTVTLGLRNRSRRSRVGFFLALGGVFLVLSVTGVGHAQFLLFVAGIAAHELRDRFRAFQDAGGDRYTAPLGVVLAIFVMPVSAWIYQGILDAGGLETNAFALRTLWTAAVLPVVIMIMATREGVVARACSWTPLRWVGNISYSYYLIHGLALKGFALVALTFLGTAPNPLLFWSLLPVAFVGSLIAASVLYAWVENPFSNGAPIPYAGWIAARTQPALAKQVVPPVDPVP